MFYKNLSYKVKFFSLAISLIIFSSIILNSNFLKHRFINQISSMSNPIIIPILSFIGLDLKYLKITKFLELETKTIE